MLGGENMANTANSFELLRAKPILTILDGDTKFGEIQISPTKVINNGSLFNGGRLHVTRKGVTIHKSGKSSTIPFE